MGVVFNIHRKRVIDLLSFIATSSPLQKICRASLNLIESLPNTISIFWKTQLQEVDFSDNVLKELPSYRFELEVTM